ncbi:VOC family protein [Zhouia sp. PK063]|uniref:VOC family protein n=1 Tax=Zhouia sp. PK063 TaxID=3373602 RepID=UPI00379EA669
MTTINVYLTFENRCEEAFNFYKKVFGGEFSFIGKFYEMLEKEGVELSYTPEEKNKITHIELPISKETILMGCDACGEWANQITPGNNFSVAIATKSKEEAFRIFNELSFQGSIMKSFEPTIHGNYFGMLTDQFGINWMITLNTTVTVL